MPQERRTKFSAFGLYQRIQQEQLPNRATVPHRYRSRDSNALIQKIKTIYSGKILAGYRNEPLSDSNIAYDVSHNFDCHYRLGTIDQHGIFQNGRHLPSLQDILSILDQFPPEIIYAIEDMNHPKLLITPTILAKTPLLTHSPFNQPDKVYHKSTRYVYDQRLISVSRFVSATYCYLLSYVEQQSELPCLGHHGVTGSQIMNSNRSYKPWYIPEYLYFQYLSEQENVANDYSNASLLLGNITNNKHTFYGYKDLNGNTQIQKIKLSTFSKNIVHRPKIDLN